ncbi:ATP-dependent Clp protease ATP-binding subunit [Patescibacteria group bacterium]|nr:ATP-dependent Clp protease ATP-binding subunit [Patescibacteria group bacterium]
MDLQNFENLSSEYLELEGRQLYWGREFSKQAIFYRSLEKIIKLIIRLALFALGFYGLYILANHLWLLSQSGQSFFNSAVWQEDYLKYFWWSVLGWCYLFYSFILDSRKSLRVVKKSFKQAAAAKKKVKRIEISKSFSHEALKILDKAYLKSLANGQSLDPLHILAGLFANNKIVNTMVRLSLPFKNFEKVIGSLVKKLPQTEGQEAGSKILKTLSLAYFLAYQSSSSQVTVLDFLEAVIKQDKVIQDVLFDYKVTEEMMANAIKWAKINKVLLERYQRHRTKAAFKPKGAMDRAMTALATPVLDSFSEDLTILSRAGYLPLCIAREKEINEVFNIIQGGRNSVVLTGLPGVGKSNVVEGIANLMVEEEVPKVMKDKRFVSLSISRLVSGAARSGELEQRVMIIMQEIIRAGNIILHIDDVHNLVGLTSAGTENIDLSEMFADFLTKKNLITIAATTPADYIKYLENNPLGQVLEKVIIDEPDDNRAIQMVEAQVGFIEGKHQAFFTYEALDKAVKLSRRYIPDHYLPDKAIKILEETAMAVLQEKGKNQIVAGEDIARVISHKTNIPLTEVSHDESEKLLHLEERIHQRLINQEEAVNLVAAALRRARAELRDVNRPIVNLLFLGPTGVGKTELAKTVAQIYFGSEDNMIRLDMSEYQLKESVNKMIGSKESGGTGILTEAVRKRPFALLLFDEIEKAHPDILNLFLQMMDDGRLTDALGRTVDFSNTIIIGTSNAAAHFIQDSIRAGKTMDEIKNQLIQEELRQYFKPEFLNRFDGTVVFKPLSQVHIKQIAGLLLAQVKKRLINKGIYLEATDEAVEELAQAGFDPTFGARPLKRVIQDRVDNALANHLLTGKIGRRDKVILEKGGELRVEKATKF